MRAQNGWTELVLVGTILVVATVFSACGHRKHLTRTHGESTRQIMQAQAINPDAGNESQPDLGLDSQEAVIVADSYLKGLSPDGGSAASAEPQILVLPQDEGKKAR